MADTLSNLSAVQLLQRLRSRRLGAVELLQHYLERVERLNPAINAVVQLDADAALARAAAADRAALRGEWWGVLHGLPLTIKDSFETADLVTTSGAPALANHRPQHNAVAVQRLIDAGAIIFGKSNLPLFANDWQSYNDVYGTTNNPWDLTRTPGGSSGGAAAALAAGLTPLELGSDIGGSIRTPAHYCGVFGHKTSYGVIPMRGHIPPGPGLLSEAPLAVAGPLARDAADLALMLDVLAGPDRRRSRGWRLQLPPAKRDNLRIAVWFEDDYCPIDSRLLAAYHELADGIEREGLQVVRQRPDDLSLADIVPLYLQQLAGVIGAGLPRKVHQALPQLQQRMAELAQVGLAAPNAPDYIGWMGQSYKVWAGAGEKQRQLQRRADGFFEQFDLLLLPVTLSPAPLHDHSADMHARVLMVDGRQRFYSEQTSWIAPATLLDLPATVAPLGVTEDGLPFGIQIVGGAYQDRTTIAFAERIGRLSAAPVS